MLKKYDGHQATVHLDDTFGASFFLLAVIAASPVRRSNAFGIIRSSCDETAAHHFLVPP